MKYGTMNCGMKCGIRNGGKEIVLVSDKEPLDEGWFNCLLWDTTRPAEDLQVIEKDLRKLKCTQEADAVKKIREQIAALKEQALDEARKVILNGWDEYFCGVNPHGGHAWQLDFYQRSDFKLKGGGKDD